jgi:carbon storage regulator
MLVLSRKKGERIVIGQNIELVVLEMRAGRVKLAIAAPPNVTICRAELRGRTGRFAAQQPKMSYPPTPDSDCGTPT